MKNEPKDTIIEDLYNVLRTIYHHERSLTVKFGLGYEEIYALQYLRRHPGIHLNDLAREMELPMFKCSRLIARLILKGLVSKSQYEADKRNILIVLQPDGEKLVKEVEERCYENIHKSSATATAEETKNLALLVERLPQYLGVADKVK